MNNTLPMFTFLQTVCSPHMRPHRMGMRGGASVNKSEVVSLTRVGGVRLIIDRPTQLSCSWRFIRLKDTAGQYTRDMTD